MFILIVLVALILLNLNTDPGYLTFSVKETKELKISFFFVIYESYKLYCNSGAVVEDSARNLLVRGSSAGAADHRREDNLSLLIP